MASKGDWISPVIIDGSIPPGLAEVREELEELKTAAKGGADMIKQLLGFSRRQALVLESVDLRAVVAEASKMPVDQRPRRHARRRRDNDRYAGTSDR